MPVVSEPVKINDALLLDGGITDAVPYAFMEAQGFQRNVIVLTQPKGYRKEPVSGQSLVIRPPQPLQIGHTEKDPNELERVYQIGIHEAENRLEDIRSFLAGGEGQ